jgi:dCTP deaminase
LILSNIDIVDCLNKGLFSINPIDNNDPSKPPFNTSAIDLRLGNEILVPEGEKPIQYDLRHFGIARFIQENSRRVIISEDNPFSLRKEQFVLGKTLERVNFPLNFQGICYSARIEGKSSIARCGILIHFTAPTIHAGFEGIITLEILNMGVIPFLLIPKMYICQLIIEEVKGCPILAPNQFRGQSSPSGL